MFATPVARWRYLAVCLCLLLTGVEAVAIPKREELSLERRQGKAHLGLTVPDSERVHLLPSTNTKNRRRLPRPPGEESVMQEMHSKRDQDKEENETSGTRIHDQQDEVAMGERGLSEEEERSVALLLHIQRKAVRLTQAFGI